jgi:hypothetical protein
MVSWTALPGHGQDEGLLFARQRIDAPPEITPVSQEAPVSIA